MKWTIIICLIILGSCKEKNASTSKDDIIEYLKTEYKVDPQINRFDSFYTKRLVSENKSLEVDSLINSNILIKPYLPLDLDFIEYHNRYSYRDKNDSDCYSIYLIRDNKTGKYYQDYITGNTCLIIEPTCMWVSMQNRISKNDFQASISDEDIETYNNIDFSRRYGEYETNFSNEKRGIQDYLNSAFKFSRPTKLQLDSLFTYYDNSLYDRNETLLISTADLFKYLTAQVKKIRSETDYGDSKIRLQMLKDQISLLVIQTWPKLSNDLFYWVYKKGSHLRVRRMKISGNQKSTYSYIIDEYEICFG